MTTFRAKIVGFWGVFRGVGSDQVRGFCGVLTGFRDGSAGGRRYILRSGAIFMDEKCEQIEKLVRN